MYICTHINIQYVIASQLVLVVLVILHLPNCNLKCAISSICLRTSLNLDRQAHNSDITND